MFKYIVVFALAVTAGCTSLQKVLPFLDPVNSDPVAQKKLQVKLRNGIYSNDPAAVEKALSEGADPNYLGKYQQRPLMVAAGSVRQPGGWVTRQKSEQSWQVFQLLAGAVDSIDAVDHNGNTALHIAIFDKKEKAAEFLIGEGARTDLKGSNEYTPLIAAAYTKQPGLVKKLIKSGNVNARDIYGNSALMWAVAEESTSGDPKTEIVEPLLKAGARTDFQNKSYGHSVIHIAAIFNRVASLKLLCGKADFNAVNKAGRTPLLEIADRAHYKHETNIVEQLIACGADPKRKDPDGNNALFVTESPHLVEWLIDKQGLDPAALNLAGQTALEHQLSRNNVTIFTLLLKRGAPYSDKNSPVLREHLWYSIYRDDIETVRLILDSGFNINAVDSDYNTALILAVYRGREEITRYLLSRNADIKVRNKVYGNTALHVAVRLDDAKLTGLLLQNGAPLDVVNSEGYTPLVIAARRGHSALARTLLNRGAGTEVTDGYGNTALMWAAWYNQPKILRLLIDNDAEPDIPNKLYGNTALHLAAMKGFAEIVKALLAAGADGSIKNKAGYTYKNVPKWVPTDRW